MSKNTIKLTYILGPSKEDGNVHLALSTVGHALDSISTWAPDSESVPDKAAAELHCLNVRTVADAVIKYKRGLVKGLPVADSEGNELNIRMEPVRDHVVKIIAEGKAASAERPSEGINAGQRLCWLLSDLFTNLSPVPVSFVKDIYGLETDGASLGLPAGADVCVTAINYTKTGGTIDVTIVHDDSLSPSEILETVNRVAELRGLEVELNR